MKPDEGEDKIVAGHLEVQQIREASQETGETLVNTYLSWLAAKEDQEDEDKKESS